VSPESTDERPFRFGAGRAVCLASMRKNESARAARERSRMSRSTRRVGMRRAQVLRQCLIAFVGLLLVAVAARALTLTPDQKLPDPVEKAFRALFPAAEIHKVDAEEEDGVMVYDFEFRDGDNEKESDITADGTMLESTLVVVPEAIPAAALKSIRATAKGADMKRLEQIKLSYETKDGKVVKLPKMVIHYACELAKGGQRAEVVVSPKGKVVDAPKWVPAEKPAPEAAPGK